MPEFQGSPWLLRGIFLLVACVWSGSVAKSLHIDSRVFGLWRCAGLALMSLTARFCCVASDIRPALGDLLAVVWNQLLRPQDLWLNPGCAEFRQISFFKGSKSLSAKNKDILPFFKEIHDMEFDNLTSDWWPTMRLNGIYFKWAALRGGETGWWKLYCLQQ